MLIRQVEAKCQSQGAKGGAAAPKADLHVPISKLISMGTGKERAILYFGWFFSACAGAVTPSFIFLLGPIFDAFGPAQSKEESFEQVGLFVGIMGVLAVCVWIFSYIQHSQLTKGSILITNRIRNAYLRAVLSQESAWFDDNEYTALATRINSECS